MPCFVAWCEHLRPGTPEYDRALAELTAKLRAVQHIVRYYYGAAGLTLPRGSRTPNLPPVPSSEKERRTWKGICHHCACDGVGCGTLYDLLTILDLSSDNERSYHHVIFGCAHMTRCGPEMFRTAQQED